LLAALAACDGGGAPMPGVLTATVVSPGGAEGAAHVRLIGAGTLGVQALDARTFSHRRGDTVDVVVVRGTPGELRFLVQVADTTARPAGAVVEVADGENRLRSNLGAYRLEVRP
jgi:outer membrane lipoprotein SlyB